MAAGARQRKALTLFPFITGTVGEAVEEGAESHAPDSLSTGSHRCFPKESERARQLKWLRFELANTIFMI